MVITARVSAQARPIVNIRSTLKCARAFALIRPTVSTVSMEKRVRAVVPDHLTASIRSTHTTERVSNDTSPLTWHHFPMETDFQVQCPFCGEVIWMEFYPEDGESQETVVDCEVCCNPIQYTCRFDRDGSAYVSAERAQ